jgi:hypothetical protein
MKHPDPTLPTPLYVKSTDDMPWPAEESCFHLLARDGLFICRNNRFFSSAVPAANFPQALAAQKLFCKIRYPKVRRRQFELIVGFFSHVAQLHQSEACVLLAWDEKAERYRLIVPKQLATCGWSSWEQKRYPVGVHYTMPTDLPPHCPVVMSVHSHVDEAAYTSHVDAADERYRAGLHVIGRPDQRGAAGDQDRSGNRRHALPAGAVDGDRGLPAPPAAHSQEWIDRVEVEVWKPKPYYASSPSYDDENDRRDGR